MAAAAAACGLDFGTSNTTLGVNIEHAGRPAGTGVRLAPLEDAHPTLPSAIFFDFEEGGVSVGRAAVGAYVAGTDGRFMRALKSVLGTDLIEEKTLLRRSRIGFRDVIARFLAETKRRAEAACCGGAPALNAGVHGRPVHFVDGDPEADARAQRVLEEIAREIGFRDVSFQYEPIAAALAYEADRVDREEIALVADVGGGTSDFSIVRLGPERRERPDRTADILANDGVRVGGTDFDRELSLASVLPCLGYRSPMRRTGLAAPNHYFTDLATWSKVNFLYVPKVLAEIRQIRRESAHPDLIDRLIRVLETRRGHTLAIETETVKIALSDVPEKTACLSWIEPELSVTVTRSQLAAATADLARRIAGKVQDCLRQATLTADRIDALFLTGGSTLLLHVRRALLAEVPAARVVEGDKFGAVGVGLTLEAARRYGAVRA